MSLDYIQGAGALDAEGAHEQLLAGRQLPGKVRPAGWDNNVIDKNAESGSIYTFEIDEPQGKFITATLSWNRHYKDEFPFARDTEADSELRLEIWAINAEDPEKGYLLDYSDSPNDNTEHIYCRTDPNYSRYEIVVAVGEIETQSTVEAAGQRYGLAWNTTDAIAASDIDYCDLNGDGLIDDSDFTILLNRLGTVAEPETGHLSGDINLDGFVDIKDLALLMAQMR